MTYRKVSFDSEHGAMYVYLRDAEVARTVTMPTGAMGLILNVDVDANGIVVGVEII